MDYLIKNMPVAKIAAVALMLLLAGCSSDASYKREAGGGYKYLNTAALKPLQASAGLSLPQANDEYVIPVGQTQGVTGKQLDIRPPVQVLLLPAGSQAKLHGDTATLLLDKTTGGSLWLPMVAMVKELHYSIEQQNDASQSLTTGWVSWQREDESKPLRARYQISLRDQGYRQLLTVKLVSLQQADQLVTSNYEIQRYSASMLNALSTALDMQETHIQDEKNKRTAGMLNVQSGADDVGLPVLIVRGSFDVVWHRLSVALEKAGMKVKDASRAQGNMNVTYKPLSVSEWQALGARDPGLPSGTYKLQVGDLDNRSSLQFIDPKGRTLTQSQNDALVAVFQAAFN